VPAAAVVDGQSFASIDADPNLCRRMVRIFAGLPQNVDDHLGDSYGTVHTLRFIVIGLGDDGMQALVMEINQHGIDAANDAVHRAVM
jgi:hypothetical protein